MGRHLLRREAIVALALAVLTAGAWAQSPGVDPPGAMPAAQGHRGAELYSIPYPDEDVIGAVAEGLLARRLDWLQVVLDRSARYRGLIARAIEERGLPRELLYLPAVESGFQPRAVSPKGATGLWQLMKNTASPYGLRMDHWVDERRDFWKATEASLAKLEENFRIFGDWHLALAAYNCGVGKLSGILRGNPGSDYWALRRKGVLPRETAAFVPQFLAVARILGYPGRNGLTLSWAPSAEWARIPVERCVDLRILARESGMPYDALAAANPELNFAMTPPASYGYQLKVPAEWSDAVSESLARADLPMVDFRVHVIAQGDTLSAMALRYGVSVEMILEANPRLAPRALRIGAVVLVPVQPPRREG
jgi:membrane-bound lytic murein transglycosylase D